MVKHCILALVCFSMLHFIANIIVLDMAFILITCECSVISLNLVYATVLSVMFSWLIHI